MGLTLDPFEIPEAWDHCLVAGDLSPGKLEISTGGRKYTWDTKDAPGAAGQSLTFRGIAPTELTLTFTLWTQEQVQAWADYSTRFLWDPTKSKTIEGLDFYHPGMQQIGVTKIVPVSVGPLIHQGGGEFKAIVEVKEWRPPPKKNVTGTPRTAKSSSTGTTGAGGGDPAPAPDELDKQIAALTALSTAQNAQP